jgi:hypothetical protein
MSHYTEPDASRGGGLTAAPSTTDVARAEAAGVGQHARDAGAQVAQTAVDQARQVAAETSRQARDLLDEAQGQVRDQASVQQQQAAKQLHSVADELHAMAANGGHSGLATEMARQAADRLHGAAFWLEQREPADLLEEVRSFARRRPGTFLIGAAVAGVAAGRLTRGLAARNGNGTQATGRRAAGGAPGSAGTGYPTASRYAAGTDPDPYAPAAPAYPASPTFTPRPGYPESAGPADAEPTCVEPADAEPTYVEPTDAEPPYPADAGRTAGTTEPGGTLPYPPAPAYPADPADPADPAYPDPAYPPEPGAVPRYEGPR